MTETELVSIMAVAAALVAGGCGSDQPDGTKPTSSSGGSAGYAPASSTPDGTQLLSNAEVASLTAAACNGFAMDPGPRPPAIELVVDTNDSMTQATPSTQGRSKWEMVQELLPQALASLPSAWAFGLSFYCGNESGNCYQGQQAVPVALNDAHQQTLLATAIQARNTCSYAPTQAAWTFGLDTIQNAPNTALADRYVVLVTDGVPTVNRDGCTLGSGDPSISQAEYDQFISTVSAQTTATGVKTFVVGVPGSDDPQGAPYDPMYELSLLAEAGGTAPWGCTSVSGTPSGNTVNPRGTYCHQQLTQYTALWDALSSIASSIWGCDYPVAPTPPGQRIDPNQVYLIYGDGQGNSHLILPNEEANCDRGWQFTDATHTYIHVCPITCQLIQSDRFARMELAFGCVPGTSSA